MTLILMVVLFLVVILTLEVFCEEAFKVASEEVVVGNTDEHSLGYTMVEGYMVLDTPAWELKWQCACGKALEYDCATDEEAICYSCSGYYTTCYVCGSQTTVGFDLCNTCDDFAGAETECACCGMCMPGQGFKMCSVCAEYESHHDEDEVCLTSCVVKVEEVDQDTWLDLVGSTALGMAHDRRDIARADRGGRYGKRQAKDLIRTRAFSARRAEKYEI